LKILGIAHEKWISHGGFCLIWTAVPAEEGSPSLVSLPAMDSSNINTLAAELRRRAEEKFGRERAEALQNDLQQLARELDSVNTYNLGFDDEP
jgi:hypothetical protein